MELLRLFTPELDFLNVTELRPTFRLPPDLLGVFFLKTVIPNLLTLSRLVLMPVSLYFLAERATGLALAVYIFIALTDFWDGYLARRWNTGTSLGVVLDQVSDKLVGLGFFLGLALLGFCPAWFLGLLVLTSAFLGFGYLFSQFIPNLSGPQASLKIGKWSTALQYIWIGWILFSVCFFGKTNKFTYVSSINLVGFIALAVLQLIVFGQYASRMLRNRPLLKSHNGHPATD
jgi:CDP-diacylglycerol--glycerol-3-phosphate 3-phosphatidyltransferase